MDTGGLTFAEAAKRLREWGPNEPVRVPRFSALGHFARLFANPLVAILLVAALISALLGQRADAGIIVAIVLLGVGLNFWQTFRSSRAVERLKQSVMPTATVMRDGEWNDVPLRDVVPGDVVRLSAGDLVPADAQLLVSRDLSVQESALTGESRPVEKRAPEAVYLGTSVISGTAEALVAVTGTRTRFGEIAERIGQRRPDTEFERGLSRFSALILRTTIGLVLFILTISLALRRDAFESLLFAVALGVGLTPEFLPLIASIVLGEGAVRMARQGVIVKHLPAIQNFGSIDVLCSDKTGTLTSGRMTLDVALDAAGNSSDEVFVLAYLNSRFETGIRSPIDTAILSRRDVDVSGYVKLDELPFDFERRRLSVVLRRPHTEGARLITKGAVEQVLDRTHLPDQARARALQQHDRLSAGGLHVVAVAHRDLPLQERYSVDDERDLEFDGFLGFADPIRADVRETVEALAADGVAVKILTGDGEGAARYACRQMALDTGRVVTGAEIARMTDEALAHVAEDASVFARVSPSEKHRIIVALRRRGHVVGFVGDGINDAPSLHSADVGISVMNATDVAKAAADVILSRPGLDVLHRGILEGRRASGNMMKYLLMDTSSNFGNMFSMAAAAAFLPFLPMLPTQILLNNVLYDLAQITIPSDRVDAVYLARPQRWDMRLVRNFMLCIGPISSVFDFLTFYVLLRVFRADEALFHTGWFVESLATQTLVLFVIRTAGSPLTSRPSAPLTATTLAIAALAAVLPFTPFARFLGLVPLPGRLGLFVAVVTVLYLFAVHAAKTVLVRRQA